MSRESYQGIDEALGVEEGEFEDQEEDKQLPIFDKSRQITEINRKEDAMEDYEKTRQTMHFLLEKGQEAVQNMVNEAKANGKARDYDSVAYLIKTVSETGKDLLEIQKQINESEKGQANDDPPVQNNTQNNYYMNREEAIERAKKRNKPQEDDEEPE